MEFFLLSCFETVPTGEDAFTLAMLVYQNAIHRGMIAAATHEYINVFHIESQNHCIAVVFPPNIL